METRPYVSWELIGDFMRAAFEKMGVPKQDAEICADVLMESDRRGIESHGCNRFKPIYIDRINAGIQKPVTEFEIIRETPTTAVVDGHDGMGMVIGHKAMSMAIAKAKQYGMGMVAPQFHHYGIAGYYATMATQNNMIGITGTNAVFHRTDIRSEKYAGNNPLTIGLPSDEEFPVCWTVRPA
jgi:LDH2 family malate/lactate/ureidoglycolate dehydrogenase